MTKTIPSPSWDEADVSYRIKNFLYTRNNEIVTPSAQKHGLENITQIINHLAAYQPKVIYQQSWPNGYNYRYTSDPLVLWSHYDYNYNGREFMVSMTANFRHNSEAYFFLTGDQFYQTTQLYGSFFGPNWIFLTIDYVRADVLNDVVSEGLSQISDWNVKLWDLVVYEKPIETLDSDIHQCVIPGKTRDHVRLTQDNIESMRDIHHKQRVQNLPMVLMWSALHTGGISATQASNEYGITITSNSLLNVWDLSSSSRVATSPGTLFYGYRAGRGNESINTNLRCVVQAYAKVTGTTPIGTIRFQGPDHIASNWHELTVTNTSFDWIGGDPDTDYFYFNTESDYNDITTAMNKLDVLASINSTNTLQIMGLFAWICYE